MKKIKAIVPGSERTDKELLDTACLQEINTWCVDRDFKNVSHKYFLSP